MTEKEYLSEIEKIKSKVETLALRKEKLETRLNREKAKLREQLRKARTSRLLELGHLVEQAGLLETDNYAFLGALYEMKTLLHDAPTYAMLQEKGREALGEVTSEH